MNRECMKANGMKNKAVCIALAELRNCVFAKLISICILFLPSTISASELQQIIKNADICGPEILVDLDGDSIAEWVCLVEKEPKPYRRPFDTRIYVYKYDSESKVIKPFWASYDIGHEGGGDGFVGKLYSADMDGNRIQDVVLIGWRYSLSEEYRGSSYEGNIYVFEWDGKSFIQKIKSSDYFFSDMTKPDDVHLADMNGDGKTEIVIKHGKKVVSLEQADGKFLEKILFEKKDSKVMDFRVSDIDLDGKDEVVIRSGDPNEPELEIKKFQDNESKTIYKMKFPNMDDRFTSLGDIREAEDKSKVIEFKEKNKAKYMKVVLQGKDEGLRILEISEKNLKNKPEKYSELKLLDARRNLFADIDGDGKEEVVSCLKEGGVAIYRIKQ